MKLYHGSTVEIIHPDITFSRDRLDFGKGFYTTPIQSQAVSWANRFKRIGKSAVVNCYEFEEKCLKNYRTLQFEAYDEAWLDFILANRMGQNTGQYDVIIGGVANDRVFNTIELLMANLINRKEALGRLIYEQNNLQICFCNQQLISTHLIFTGREIL